MNKFQDNVEKEIRKLKARIAESQKSICIPSHNADPADAAKVNEEQEISTLNMRADEKLLRQLYSALNRINNDDYEWCESCGEDIGVGRLMAVPYTKQCIECASLQGIKNKHLRVA